MSIRVKVIIAASLIASYFVIDGLAMARYQNLHPAISCEHINAAHYAEMRQCNSSRKDRLGATIASGLGWPVYLLISFGIELGENHE